MQPATQLFVVVIAAILAICGIKALPLRRRPLQWYRFQVGENVVWGSERIRQEKSGIFGDGLFQVEEVLPASRTCFCAKLNRDTDPKNHQRLCPFRIIHPDVLIVSVGHIRFKLGGENFVSPYSKKAARKKLKALWRTIVIEKEPPVPALNKTFGYSAGKVEYFCDDVDSEEALRITFNDGAVAEIEALSGRETYLLIEGWSWYGRQRSRVIGCPEYTFVVRILEKIRAEAAKNQLVKA